MYQHRPSKSHRWTNCTLYPSLAVMFEQQPEIDAAREGTAAAWVAEHVIRGSVKQAIDMVDATHENLWVVDADMCDLVQQYCNTVLLRKGVTFAEKGVKLSDQPLIQGTLDSGTICFAEGKLFLDDLKYGRKIVEAYHNTQLIIYAAALLMSVGERASMINEIQLGIYQPRAMHPEGVYRTWTLSRDELFQWADWIINRAQISETDQATATPGSWCLYCEAAAGCDALTQTSYNLVAIAESIHWRNPTSEELSRELDFIKEACELLDIRKKAVESEAVARHKQDPIPNYTMVKSFGKRVLRFKPDTIFAMTGVDARNNKPCTPKELERRGVSPEFVKFLSKVPETGFKLIKKDPHQADKIFGKSN